jgi:hypothetical protein
VLLSFFSEKEEEYETKELLRDRRKEKSLLQTQIMTMAILKYFWQLMRGQPRKKEYKTMRR